MRTSFRPRFHQSRRLFPPFVGNDAWRKDDSLKNRPMKQTALLSTLLAVASINPALEVRDVDGHGWKPFRVEKQAVVLFFLSTECPISRFYASEIQRMCRAYASKGVQCGLVFEDLPLNPASVRQHLQEFGYRGLPAAIDASYRVARQAGAVVTPQAVVLDKTNTIRYRGRIDDYYADLGKPRRQATQRNLADAMDAVLAGRAVAIPNAPAVGCAIPQD
jgi:thiol-disulfide isomerase/thioredoxin